MTDPSRRDVYAALEVLGCSPYGLATKLSTQVYSPGQKH